jgi:hypothetical protein
VRISMTDPGAKTDHILLPFERRAIPEHYRPYYSAKRNNFLASIQGTPDLWRYFQLLDRNLLSEFEDMGTVNDTLKMVPLTLFFNAHAKIRVAVELAFSRCMEEARSILRDAVETAMFAHYMHADPDLQKIWLSKDDGKQAKDAFTQAFEKNKKTKLFNGQRELYTAWGRLSETGAHATPLALVNRFKIHEDSNNIYYRLNYTGIEDRAWEPETFTMLLTVSTIEKLVFDDHQARLHLDNDELVRNRGLAELLKERLRKAIIDKYNIQPRGSTPPQP